MSVRACLFSGWSRLVHGAGGQLGKGIIGGGEDGEGTFTLEGVNQSGGLKGSNQGGEAAICYGGVNDVLEHGGFGGIAVGSGMAVGAGVGVAAGAQAASAIIPTITTEKTNELLFMFLFSYF